jgi:hypothetical protein
MRSISGSFVLVAFVALAGTTACAKRPSPEELDRSSAAILPAPRSPCGVYIMVDGGRDYANFAAACVGSLVPCDPHVAYKKELKAILDNDAVAGILVTAFWNDLEPNEGDFQMAAFDDAFAVANAETPPKTVQMGSSPGFHTPDWMIAKMTSCDGLFYKLATFPPSADDTPIGADPDCDYTTFFQETQGQNGHPKQIPLPLPWSATYKSEWAKFVTELATDYGSEPTLVSITVSGPTSSSSEMILPNDNLSHDPLVLPRSSIPSSLYVPVSPMLTNKAWARLLANHYGASSAYANTDQAFIDEWNNAIDVYESVFHGITIGVTNASHMLPDFPFDCSSMPFSVAPGYEGECPAACPEMSCAAMTQVFAHLAATIVPGAFNGAMVQMDALRANWQTMPNSIRWMTAATASPTSGIPETHVLGGLQNSGFASTDSVNQGCFDTVVPPGSDAAADGCAQPSGCNDSACWTPECMPAGCWAPDAGPPDAFTSMGSIPAADLISPQQAITNDFAVAFNGTAAGPLYAQDAGTAPLNFIQIWKQDFQYAVDGGATTLGFLQEIDDANQTLQSQTCESVVIPPSPKVPPIEAGPGPGPNPIF